MTRTWWRQAVVYQIYIRSFADGNGDGIGDLAGIRSRLPYLKGLGVDAIWITPWYPSPLNDGGYDVADYRDIDPRYGSLAEAEALVAEAHEQGIRVVIDLVPNHTSSDHAWFQEALASPPGHPSRDRYIFRPGNGPGGARPPSNWLSLFGGPAWTRLPDGEWYLHLFDASQPDLNWDHPEVKAEFEDILRFWLDRGIDGLRVDVAHALVKDTDFPDAPEEYDVMLAAEGEVHPFWDRDDLHDIARGWRKVLDGYEGDRMMVAEAWVSPSRLAQYLRPDEYHQVFTFPLVDAEWNPAEWRDLIQRTLDSTTGVGSAPTWVLSNHDIMRHHTRFGLPVARDWRDWLVQGPSTALDPVVGLQRGRAAELVVLSLPGSVYLYQGEELGLPDVWDLPDEVLDDPLFFHSGGKHKGRDGCRVPIPWTRSGPSFGFGAAEPWLPQPTHFAAHSVEAQEGVEGSTLEMVRQALRLRREHLLGDEDLAWLDLGPKVLAFRRGSGLVCVANFGDKPVRLPEATVLVASAPLTGVDLPANAAAWLIGAP